MSQKFLVVDKKKDATSELKWIQFYTRSENLKKYIFFFDF